MKKILAIVLVALLYSGCASSTAAGAVGADRSQLMLVSAASMNEMAAQQYAQVLAQAKLEGKLDSDKALSKRVSKIANRLIAKVDTFRPDAKSWAWQVHTIDEDTLNAWCMPGGLIVVYSGIVNKLKLSDAELAAILGHEIAHALREHSRERASQEQIKSVGISAISSIFKLGQATQAGINLATKYTISLPFSRSHESEADAIGTELMARAGYDPRAAVKVWQKMSAQNKQSTPELLSTHPSHETRIKELSQIADKLEPIYMQSKGAN